MRILHIPSGLSVKCTEHRTQLQNRSTAMERLTAKLLVVLEEQQAAALADIRGDIVKAEWGQQIRNYVFQPYKLVKDTRTGACTWGQQLLMLGLIVQSLLSLARLLLRRSTTAHPQHDLSRA